MKSRCLICCLLCCAAGCALLVPVQVPNRGMDKLPLFDPNEYGIRITAGRDGNDVNYQFVGKLQIDAPKITRVPYSKNDYNLLKIAVVRGTLNGKTYPVVFDTGNSVSTCLIEDIHIKENNLPVHFCKNRPGQTPGFGLAMVDTLQIGDLEITNFPALFWKHHSEVKFVGIPLFRSRHINFPLHFMAVFKYVVFDDIEKRLVLSGDSFVPASETEWLPFPFEIRENQILLQVAIEDIDVLWLIDTGVGEELRINTEIAEKLFTQRPDIQKGHKQNCRSFNPYTDGLYSGKKITAKNLSFGHCTLSKVMIYQYNNSGKNVPYQGWIGLPLFKDTVMVLDFERNLLWVKQTKGGRFRE